ncbi:MAG: hypothetical protein ACJZ8Y_10060 [Pirellulaceae bacterium]|tara:strand:+ start:24311 stop:25333 length:1023 start_codon:yes stop_codon:yes gene_type:complete
MYASTQKNLVYPRTKPLGPFSENSAQAIRKKASHGTEVVDYLKISIYDPKEGNNSSYNYIKKKGAGTAGKDKLKQSIYLYLPNKLREGYQAKYNGVNLGPVGSKAVGAAADAIAAGGLSDSFGSQVSAMAKSAKPQLGYSLGAQAINTVIGMTGGSGNLNPNDLAALTTGKVFNPYEETIFQGMEFRDHRFDFMFAPKNAQDVKMIVDIIETFRVAMLPGKDKGDFLTIPDYFKMEIVRYVSRAGEEELRPQKKNSAKNGVLQKLMQFPAKMVLVNMDLDMSPYGNYSSLQTNAQNADDYDFGPIAYSMQLAFKETSYLTRESYGYDTKGKRITYPDVTI